MKKLILLLVFIIGVVVLYAQEYAPTKKVADICQIAFQKQFAENDYAIVVDLSDNSAHICTDTIPVNGNGCFCIAFSNEKDKKVVMLQNEKTMRFVNLSNPLSEVIKEMIGFFKESDSYTKEASFEYIQSVIRLYK